MTTITTAAEIRTLLATIPGDLAYTAFPSGLHIYLPDRQDLLIGRGSRIVGILGAHGEGVARVKATGADADVADLVAYIIRRSRWSASDPDAAAQLWQDLVEPGEATDLAYEVTDHAACINCAAPVNVPHAPHCATGNALDAE